VSKALTQGCFKKAAYESKAAAKQRHPHEKAYRCQMCGKFHVSSGRSHRQVDG
jgi:hypothetical protein